jgi:hypothetical protein
VLVAELITAALFQRKAEGGFWTQTEPCLPAWVAVSSPRRSLLRRSRTIVVATDFFDECGRSTHVG